jgi:hypothetical protein
MAENNDLYDSDLLKIAAKIAAIAAYKKVN